MKKYLLTLCGLAMIATIASCGDNKKESFASESIRVSETTTTEAMTSTTTTIPPKITEEKYKDEEITLDSELECDYLKIAKSSKWQEKSKMEGDEFQAFLDWSGIDNGPYYFINLELTKSTLGNMSQLDLQKYYEGLFEYRKENNENADMSILNSFSKNGQAYIILVSEKDLLRMIHFSTDDVDGHFIYSSENEDIVMDMIESIEFKKSAVITIETVSENPVEPKTEKSAPESSETLGQKNALKSAESYVDLMVFSYLKLIDQLEYEGYSHEEAVYGTDNCGANWNAEALDAAKSYLDIFGYSYQGLYNQLTSKYGKRFTASEAQYAVDNCGADWYAEAAECAKGYIDSMPFSREELLNQLLYEGFTQEQAEYGVQSVGY